MNGEIASGRARRALRVGTLSTQVGTSYLVQTLLKPFRSSDGHRRELVETHVRNALRLVESSEELRGAFTKLVQMLSMRDDVFPPEALAVLGDVQSSAPPMAYRVVREQIRAELGKLPERLFARFEREAFAAASLGQVHGAVLPSGEPVAVKVQYPGIAKTVEHDLENVRSLLEALCGLAGDLLGHRVDPAEVCRELEERLREELDYDREASNVELFARLFDDDEEVEIPRVERRLSSGRVLTMSRLEGYGLAEVLAPGVDQELKDWVAIKMFRVFCRQLLDFGVLHTDPHPGNYLVTHHPHLGILDFGSVRVFSPPLHEAYRRLARAVGDRDREEMTAACRDLDFLDPEDSGDRLVEILETLLEPLLVDRAYELRDYAALEKAAATARAVIDGRLYRAPGHRVFLIRALIGLEATLKQLGTRARWRRVFLEELDRSEKGKATPASTAAQRTS